jgi:hypothetical protein
MERLPAARVSALKAERSASAVQRRAVVMASIIVIIADYFLAKALQVILGTQ